MNEEILSLDLLKEVHSTLKKRLLLVNLPTGQRVFVWEGTGAFNMARRDYPYNELVDARDVTQLIRNSDYLNPMIFTNKEMQLPLLTFSFSEQVSWIDFKGIKYENTPIMY